MSNEPFVTDEREEGEYLLTLGPEYFWLEIRYALTRWLMRRFAKAAHRERRRLDLLDIGCGPGNCLRGLSHRIRCFGTDQESRALKVARAVSGAEVFSSDVARLPVRSESMDCAILLDVAEHVADDAALFREVVRVLRPGGLAFVTVPAYQFLFGKHDELVGHHRRYSRTALLGKIEKSGLQTLESRYLLPFTFFALVGLRAWKRLRRSERDDFFEVSPFFNSLFSTYLFAESTLSRFAPIPWGMIVYAVVQRPRETTS